MKNKKGITLLILVITIIILGLIATPVVVSVNNVIKYNRMTKMYEDIATLKEAINFAFPIENGDLNPEQVGSRIDVRNIYINGKNVNDDPNGYILIDMQKLNQKLNQLSHKPIEQLNYGEVNYGKSSTVNDLDKYIINKVTRTIYYLKGVEAGKNSKLVMTDENNHSQSNIKKIMP